MSILFSFIAGLIVGLLVSILINNPKPALGVLRIDHSNPDRDMYKFEIDNLDELESKKRIELEIDHVGRSSQK